MKRINEHEWTSELVRGRVAEICVSSRTGEIVILGSPDTDESKPEDEWHNCDAMGCGQSHVLWRRKP